jgi:hypothetical protein
LVAQSWRDRWIRFVGISVEGAALMDGAIEVTAQSVMASRAVDVSKVYG